MVKVKAWFQVLLHKPVLEVFIFFPFFFVFCFLFFDFSGYTYLPYLPTITQRSTLGLGTKMS